MSKFLILNSVGGYGFDEMGIAEFAQQNLTPIDTSERDALVIPAGATPVCYNSDVSALQIKVGATWYSLATQAYADALVVGLWDDRGNYDASGNVFPSTGGSGTAGAIKKGDIWTISVPGTLGGNVIGIGAVARALVDTPGQTAANWALGENNLGYTPENTANKATGFGTLNNTLYPTTAAVDARITSRGTENGVLANTVANVGTDADLLEKTLKTMTLAANTLAVDGSYIEVESFLITGANANNKTIRLYFGSTAIGSIIAQPYNAKIVTMSARIMRNAPGGQFCVCTVTVADTTGTTISTTVFTNTTETLSGAIIIKVTATNGVATADDIIAKNMSIKNMVAPAP